MKAVRSNLNSALEHKEMTKNKKPAAIIDVVTQLREKQRKTIKLMRQGRNENGEIIPDSREESQEPNNDNGTPETEETQTEGIFLFTLELVCKIRCSGLFVVLAC